MLTCLVIDDQKEAVDLLCDHIKLIPSLLLKKCTTDPVEALNFLDEQKVDIIFLDIQMPGLTGLELIENLKEKFGINIPKIILTTGYDNYALESYNYGVFDFLLKPISFKRFKISIDRLLNEIRKYSEAEEVQDFIFVDLNGKKVRIDHSDVIGIEGAGNYINIVTATKKYIIYKSMNAMQEILPSKIFLRVHKSHIINITKIKAIKGTEIDIGTGAVIPIGNTYKDFVFKKLQITN